MKEKPKDTRLLTGISPEDFADLLRHSSKACLLVIGANWCGSYHMISRQIDELEEEFSRKLCVHHIDFDYAPALMRQYGLSKPPALLFFKDGELRDKLLETAPKDIIRDRIIRLLW